MAEIEIPPYFVCPISFQIMKEPVTTITGITYDKESIEKWLMKAKNCVCPVTNQSLPRSSEYLTPNHTLKRLIQAWISSNEAKEVDQIQSPKSSINRTHLNKLVKNLELPHCYENSMEKIHELAKQSERNRTCMVEVGVTKVMVMVIKKSFKEGNVICLEEGLKIIRLLWHESMNKNMMKPLVGENIEFINSLTWILQLHIENNNFKIVNEAMPLLKLTIDVMDSTLLGNLNIDFFIAMVRVLQKRALFSKQAIKSALHVLIDTYPLGRNRIRIVEAGAITELIELELEKPEKNVTELVFNLLAHLCSCADGREQFLRHAAGIAMITKRILRVSTATDDRAIQVIFMIARYSSSKDIVLEMLRVGAVSKLCMVMQADCSSYLKEKARDILRLHSSTWNNSPCIQVYLMTRHQR
ncbi:E3 ubiquitin-protein ligase PUB23-like [Cicer arietinum]|uniref:U-box domain-containing protein n=1 Tax=Cicer arietinum TaxID=3827 RepID=A0A1S2YKS8_CICAR|nr:E3 ubiquitin-protein ligase PUB23-like [Cicer arietinum]